MKLIICNVFESLFTKKIDEFILKKIQDSLLHLLNKINKEDIVKMYYNKCIKNPLSEFRDKINDEINKIKVFISKLNTVRNKINKDEIYICTINDFKNLFFKKFEYNFYSRIINSIDEIILNPDYTPYSSDLYYKNKDKCNSDISEYTAIKKDLKKMKLFLSLLMSVTEKNANSYRLVLSHDIEKKISFGIYCIDSSFGMKKFLEIKPYSVILTS